MRPTAPLAAIAALCLPLVAACAAESRQSDAEALRDRLTALPGVAQVSLDYTAPVTLDSGKLELRVEMATDSAGAITEVVTTTYEAFAGVHREEEGDLDVRLGDDVVHLRSFEPVAETAAVEEAAAQAVDVLRSGSVRADVDTQDVSRAPHVSTAFAVTVEEPSSEAVLERFSRLEQEHPDVTDAGWRVHSGVRGWSLGADRGFPDSEAAALFETLGTGLPDGASVLLHDDMAEVRLPPGTSPAEASAVVARHLALLGGAEQAFYHVQSGRSLLAAIIGGECSFDTGEVGAQLERDHADVCTEVSHP